MAPTPAGLGVPVGRHGFLGLRHLLRCGREDLVGDRHLAGVDGPLAVEAERARLECGAPVALEVLIGRVGRVDGVDQPGPCRREHLHPGEVPEVARVLDDGVEVAVDAGVQGSGEIPGAEDERLEPVAGLRDLERVGQALGLLYQHLQADGPGQAQLRLELGQQHVDPPHVAGPTHLGHYQHVDTVARARHHLNDVAVTPRRLNAVDAHGAHGASPVEAGERADGNGPGRLLDRGRAGVLEVEEDEVGSRRRRLLAHALAAGRRGQLRTTSSWCAHSASLVAGWAAVQMMPSARSAARRSASRPSSPR